MGYFSTGLLPEACGREDAIAWQNPFLRLSGGVCVCVCMRPQSDDRIPYDQVWCLCDIQWV